MHALRVATLRLTAEVEHWRQGHEEDQASSQAAKRWTTQAGKLRRALSEVREIDVHLAKLAGLRPTLVVADGYQPRANKLSLRQLRAFERTLKRDRCKAAERLAKEIGARLARLESVSRGIEARLSTEHPQQSDPAAKSVFRMFQDVVEDFPKLDAECLHDFRKRIKKVRYPADLFARNDLEAKRLAAGLKTMQVATGEWHDCQALARLAQRRFHNHAKDDALEELLETLAAESLERALAICEHQIEQLSRPSAARPVPLPALQRKISVRRAEPSDAVGERRLA